ncbi:hypothetical protein [Aeromicrobium sp.]|uniref:hypothetical protein n=1 Tax=Aeromicrobium sp. TaxID=1871063 RepID=UPI0019C3AF86|nr:hypothetical protein [Aeromicrobium sp.]MBC7632838.1 hypothetical protein [Aeromicrobium sp.]
MTFLARSTRPLQPTRASDSITEPPRVPRVLHARRLTVVALAAIILLIIGFSASFGRAQPIGSYRPDLPPPALTNGCRPLPDGVAFAFPHQVRSDGDVGPAGHERRRLVMQYDLIDADAVRRKVTEAFLSAGFVQAKPPSPGGLVLTERGVGRVGIKVTALKGVPETSIVRGTLVLDLPVSELTSHGPACSQPYSTKQFPPQWDTNS